MKLNEGCCGKRVKVGTKKPTKKTIIVKTNNKNDDKKT